MANTVSPNNPPDVGGVFEVAVGGVVEVDSPLIGRSIIDGLRRKFSAGGQIKEGDYFMDRSRDLLRRHLQLIEVHDQDTIRLNIDEFVYSIYILHLVNCGATVCEILKIAW
jgi:hypothetical protein